MVPYGPNKSFKEVQCGICKLEPVFAEESKHCLTILCDVITVNPIVCHVVGWMGNLGWSEWSLLAFKEAHSTQEDGGGRIVNVCGHTHTLTAETGLTRGWFRQGADCLFVLSCQLWSMTKQILPLPPLSLSFIPFHLVPKHAPCGRKDVEREGEKKRAVMSINRKWDSCSSRREDDYM